MKHKTKQYFFFDMALFETALQVSNLFSNWGIYIIFLSATTTPGWAQ